MAFFQPQYKTPVIGEKYYKEAMATWKGAYSKYSDLVGGITGEMREYLPELKATTEMYKPGGEASKYLMGEGSRDIGYGTAVGIKSGMSGLAVGPRLNRERRDLRTNVTMATAGLANQALQPYLQLSQTIGAMMQGLSGFMSSMPNFASSVKLGQPSVASMKRMPTLDVR